MSIIFCCILNDSEEKKMTIFLYFKSCLKSVTTHYIFFSHHTWFHYSSFIHAWFNIYHRMLSKNFSRQHFEIFFLFFTENRFWHFMWNVSNGDSLKIKCQILFSKKNKKNIINLSSAEFANRVLRVEQSNGPISNKEKAHRPQFAHLSKTDIVYLQLRHKFGCAIRRAKVILGSSLNKHGRPWVPNAIYQVSALKFSWFWQEDFKHFLTIYGHGGDLIQWCRTTEQLVNAPSTEDSL